MIPTFAALMAIAVGALLEGERSGRRRLVLIAKPAASLLFLLLAALLLPTRDPYAAWLLLGLAFAVAGDVLLLVPTAFLAGLIAFLLAHLCYTAAFATAAPPIGWRPVWAVPVLACSAAVLAYLWPRLHRRRLPVAIYVTVISGMVWGGIAVWRLTDAWLPAAGAALFYLSDLAVARDRFMRPGFANKAWGLPTYYAAQLLLAASLAG